MPFAISPEERAALEAACEALIPSLQGNGKHEGFWKATAKDFDVAGQILEIIADQNLAEQHEFRQLLGLLNSKVAGLIFGGGWTRFREMPLEDRVAMLRKWMGSRINLLRKAFGTLKKLSMFLHYGSHIDHENPTWAANGYRPLREVAAGPRPAIHPRQFTQDTILDCDVVVVGSGAGGGLAAGVLAEAGLKVVLLEKGPFMAGEDFTQHEVELIRKTYDKQGAFQTADGSVTVFAGACLGGGTTINWTGAFQTPDYVLDEWADAHGLAFATTPAYQACLARVQAATSVNTDNSPHNPQNKALWQGSEKLGDAMHVIARNVVGCQASHGTTACGFCGLGCRGGHKRGTLATYIQRAAARGADIVVGTTVHRILQADGKAAGVEAIHQGPDGRQVTLTGRANRVVLAAGSIHTPALLLRSGIAHAGIGKNLFFHPTVGVTALYAERMEPWLGVMMSAVNKQHQRIDGNYGYWIETPPVHPGVGALAIPWESPAQHKADLLQAAHLASFIVLTRDKFGGRVTIDKAGHPVVDYRLSSYDRDHMLQGIRKAFDIHRLAGARQVYFPHATRKVYNLETSKLGHEDFLAYMPDWGWRANQAAIFTAHQMGTCAMGADPVRHPVDLQGQLRALPGVFVADGSLLPTAAGVNPMMTIMAMADWVVQGMVADL